VERCRRAVYHDSVPATTPGTSDNYNCDDKEEDGCNSSLRSQLALVVVSHSTPNAELFRVALRCVAAKIPLASSQQIPRPNDNDAATDDAAAGLAVVRYPRYANAFFIDTRRRSSSKRFVRSGCQRPPTTATVDWQ